jgi:hypothetical protein
VKFWITSGSPPTKEEQLVRLEWAPIVATEGRCPSQDSAYNPMRESAWHLRDAILEITLTKDTDV